MKLLDAIETRRSIKSFRSKKVSWSDILEAIDAASKAPFAGNINNLKFIIIEDQETKNKIGKHTQQFWLTDAQFIIIVCSDESQLINQYNERGKIYSRQHAGAAIENFLLRITDIGLSSCWIGAFSDELIKQVLKIPEHINIEAILPVGYAMKKVKMPKKAVLENLMYWEAWKISKKPTRSKDPKI